MKKLSNILIISWLLVLAACTDQFITPDTTKLAAAYFPIEKGLYWEYEVDLVIYNLSDSVLSHYFLREVATDTFTDLSGSTSYRVKRFIRPTASDSWKPDSLWTARVSTSQAIRIENNIPFVKLTFPLAEGKRWNGNALNNRGKEIYEVKNLGATLEAGNTVYTNSLEVVQEDLVDVLVSRDERREFFAEGIGLIKKEYIQIEYCSKAECFGLREIDSGRKLFMELVAYGKE